jgi:hypothetical protein
MDPLYCAVDSEEEARAIALREPVEIEFIQPAFQPLPGEISGRQPVPLGAKEVETPQSGAPVGGSPAKGASCPRCGQATSIWNRDLVSGVCQQCLGTARKIQSAAPPSAYAWIVRLGFRLITCAIFGGMGFRLMHRKQTEHSVLQILFMLGLVGAMFLGVILIVLVKVLQWTCEPTGRQAEPDSPGRLID